MANNVTHHLEILGKANNDQISTRYGKFVMEMIAVFNEYVPTGRVMLSYTYTSKILYIFCTQSIDKYHYPVASNFQMHLYCQATDFSPGGSGKVGEASVFPIFQQNTLFSKFP